MANYAAACIAVTLLYTLIVPRSSPAECDLDNVVRFNDRQFWLSTNLSRAGNMILRRVQRRFQASLLLRALIQVLPAAGRADGLHVLGNAEPGLNPDSLAYYFSPFHLLPILLVETAVIKAESMSS